MIPRKCRIYFELDSSDWHGHGSERVWAERIEGSDSVDLYRILNSPFFVKGVSYLDVVRVVFQQNGEYDECKFLGVIERSQHSTYMILMDSQSDQFQLYWSALQSMGCTYKSTWIDTSMGRLKIYSVDVPCMANVREIYSLLEAGEAKGHLMFQEGHVGQSLI